VQITSATFVKSVVGQDAIFSDGLPQVACIGRSNAGKSSVINSLTKQPGLAKTSSFPGRTQQINLFLVNKLFYLVDLPGYGFTKTSKEARKQLEHLINWYLFTSGYNQHKVVLIIDAALGLTRSDLDMLHSLEQHDKNVIVVANKIDTLKKSQYAPQLEKIANQALGHVVVPYSSVTKVGTGDLVGEILK
jgi:GTP-binding protein